MRVLCTVTGSPSHARAMLPLVTALAAGDGEVLIAAPPQLAPLFAGGPVRTTGVLADPHAHMDGLFRGGTGAGARRQGTEPEHAWAEVFAGSHLADSAAALLPVARAFRPDLVVRDGGEFAGCLVAEALGLPHVSAPSGAANHLDPVRLLPVLNEHRGRLGLPVAADPHAIHRYGRLDCMPPPYSFTVHPARKTIVYRQPSEIDPAETLAPWMAELPTDKPLVIAAVGTVLPMLARLRHTGAEIPRPMADLLDVSDLLDATVAALSQLDCTALVATGGVPLEPTRRNDNVHLVDHFPQPPLLRCAQLFLTHGGYNSIREAVGAGVPMAVAPRFGDQFANADRVQELGLGRRVVGPGETPVADDIAAACARLLDDPRVTARTRRAQRHMLALPPVASAVADLERLVRAVVPGRPEDVAGISVTGPG
ncbi:glycosyltransferase [Streptomyces syringium]|uniref:glycosyltransferase n=1 Tax=Streptomyces syringium TaxID=76729 RepID=UPI003D91D948